MGIKMFHIDEFLGLDQSRDENAMQMTMSPDACNIDTDNGALRVAKGYVKHIAEAIPGTGDIHRLFIYTRTTGDIFMACAGNSIYAYQNGAWSEIYTYGGDGLTDHRFDFAEAQINSTDNLIIGTGETQLVKYDGTTASLFGSSANVSDKHVLYLAMYRGRLFAAGDSEYPNRLYYSQLPGSDRSIENWGPYSASANVEGGHMEAGSIGSDRIVGIEALSNQLLIFKERSIYRLIGDKPSNFIIEEVDSRAEKASYTSMVRSGDALYFMTAGGMCMFNGVSAQPMADARRIRKLVDAGDVSNSKAACCRDKVYFTLTDTDGDALIEYDLVRGAYMQRRGFPVSDIASLDGTLYLVNENRYVYRFNEGESYDGEPIDAWWRTPETDLNDKSGIKSPRTLYLRGTSTANAATLIDIKLEDRTEKSRIVLPDDTAHVYELGINGEGRTFSLKFYNEAGGRFALVSGIELEFEWRRRT